MELIRGDIADYRLDDSGILFSYSKSVLRTVPLMEANAALVKQMTGGKPVPLLIFLKNSPMPDKATRQYSKAKIPELYSAMAMVSKPGLSSFIMKLLFAFQKPPIPMKSFTDELEAKAWLLSL
ncbi:MAG: hypothetical protein RI995_600 [Bacteroidota bacterium]|jgi:hypothetical protein